MNLKAFGGKLIGKVSKKSPEILIVVGIGGLIASTVMACKKSKEAGDILEDFKEEKENLKALSEKDEEGEKNLPKEMAKVYLKTSFELVKVYYKPVLLGTASILCILGSHRILNKRLAGVTAAYTSIDNAFKKYRKRVVDKLGEGADKEFLYGTKEETVKVLEKGKDGEDKLVDKKCTTLDGTDDISDYGRWFGEGHSREYEKNNDAYNLAFLKGKETYFNQILHARGHVFLNEVYDELGFERTPAGQVVGWLDKGKGDGFIDFGIVGNTYRENKNHGVNTDCKVFSSDGYLLDFNVDGVIWDKI